MSRPRAPGPVLPARWVYLEHLAETARQLGRPARHQWLLDALREGRADAMGATTRGMDLWPLAPGEVESLLELARVQESTARPRLAARYARDRDDLRSRLAALAATPGEQP